MRTYIFSDRVRLFTILYLSEMGNRLTLCFDMHTLRIWKAVESSVILHEIIQHSVGKSLIKSHFFNITKNKCEQLSQQH